jgi:hypothetical protein
MALTVNGTAAILLLRDLADQIEKEEVVVSSLTVGLEFPVSDVYAPVPRRLEVSTVTKIKKSDC